VDQGKVGDGTGSGISEVHEGPSVHTHSRFALFTQRYPALSYLCGCRSTEPKFDHPCRVPESSYNDLLFNAELHFGN